MAIRHGMLVAANLPQVVWKALVSQPVTLEDLRAIDAATAEAIDSLAKVVDEVRPLRIFFRVAVPLFPCLDRMLFAVVHGAPMCSTGWRRLRVFVFRPTLLVRCLALVVLLASQKGNSAALQHYAGTLLQVCAQGSLCDMYRCSDDFVG